MVLETTPAGRGLGAGVGVAPLVEAVGEEAWNTAIVCCFPLQVELMANGSRVSCWDDLQSTSVKSFWVNPVTGPCLSRTTTSTCTSRVPLLKTGGSCARAVLIPRIANRIGGFIMFALDFYAYFVSCATTLNWNAGFFTTPMTTEENL